MRPQPIPLVGGSYADEDRPYSMQDTVNYLPCRPEVDGTRSGEMLKTPPGLRPYLELPDLDPPVKRTVRGTHDAEGRFFAVMGTTAYRISNAGVAIPLGTIPGNGRVQIEHNQISLGNEVTFVTGSAGYVYNTVTDAFARITDPGYPGSTVAKFIDGFMIGIEPQGRYAFNSSAANATAFNTLDRFTSEVRPDRLTAAAVSNNELVLFSLNSAEFFYNSGAAQQPFRTKRISMDKGCVGPFAAIEADNTVFWLGPGGYFYQLEGYGAKRISKRPIEQSLRGVDLSKAFATVWEDAGHTVIYWTFPNGLTWGWDTSQQEWHRRESYGLGRWRANTLTKWNDAWYAGDFQKPRLWRLDWDYILEGDQEFESYRTLGVIHDNQSLMLHSRIELVMDTGQPETVAIAFPGQPEGPSITGDLPDGVTGDVVDYDYTLASGTPAYVVTLRSGELPAGLTLSSSGTLSGTRTDAGDYSWVVRVTDSNGLWDEVEDESTTLSLAPVLMTDTKGYYGLKTAIAPSASTMGWTGAVTMVRACPGGLYAVAAIEADVTANRFQFRKYDPETDTWSALAAPATLPTQGPTDMAWSPDGNYLACSTLAASPNNQCVYKRVGDTLTKIANPTSAMTSINYSVAWDSEGARVAFGNGTTGGDVYVYDFVGELLVNQKYLSISGSMASPQRVSFLPGADSRYLACGETNTLCVVDVLQTPMVVADAIAGDARFGIHWKGSGYLLSVGSVDTAALGVWSFTGGVGSEALAFVAFAPTLPANNPHDSSLTSDGLYMAIATSADQFPILYSIGTASPPVPAMMSDPSASGAFINTVSWVEDV